MSDPAKTAEEIEDVLASIRRLVSDQGAGGEGNAARSSVAPSGTSSPTRKAPALVLAPSFRVAESEDHETDSSDREAEWHPDDRLAHYDAVGADTVAPADMDPEQHADMHDPDVSEEDLADMMLLDGALGADSNAADPVADAEMLPEAGLGDFESDTGDENWPGDGAEAALLSLVARRDPALTDEAAEIDGSGGEALADEPLGAAPADRAASDPDPMEQTSDGADERYQFEPEDVPDPHAEADMSWILDPASAPDPAANADTDKTKRDQADTTSADTSAQNAGPTGEPEAKAAGNPQTGIEPDASDAASATSVTGDWVGLENEEFRSANAAHSAEGAPDSSDMRGENVPDHADESEVTADTGSADDGDTDADRGIVSSDAAGIPRVAPGDSVSDLAPETDIETAMAGVFAVPPPPIFSRRAQAETSADAPRASDERAQTDATVTHTAAADMAPDLGAFLGSDGIGAHGEPGDSGVSRSDDGILDEDTLRDIIAEVVREELRGVLGQRITRNVRKMVRREIRLALAADDLD